MTICLLLGLLLVNGPDQVAQIENGMQPKQTKAPFKLVEDLRIGPDLDISEFVWSGSEVKVDVDKQGNMYVADVGENRVIMIDSDGNLVRQIGQKGQGPGEFEWLYGYFILSDGRGMGLELRHSLGYISYYDTEQNFIREDTFQQNAGYLDLFPSPTTNVFVGLTSEIIQEDGKEIDLRKYGVMNDKFEIVKVTSTYKVEAFPDLRKMKRKDWLRVVADRYRADAKGFRSFFDFDNEGNVYTAAGSKYEITKWDSSLNKVMVISRDYKPSSRTEEEMKAISDPIRDRLKAQLPPQFHRFFDDAFMSELIELSGFNSRKPPIAGLRVTPQGEILVNHHTDPVTNRNVVDIFDGTGVYLSQISIPNNGIARMVFRGNHAYTIEDLDDSKYLVRYKVARD